MEEEYILETFGNRLESFGNKILIAIAIGAAARIVETVIKAFKVRNAPSAETKEPVFEEAARKERNTTFSEIEPTYILTTPMETKKQKKKGMPANKPNRTEHHAAEEKQRTHNNAADTEKAKPAVSIDDFDLRKAIIYSEIMTPKFKEEQR